MRQNRIYNSKFVIHNYFLGPSTRQEKGFAA